MVAVMLNNQIQIKIGTFSQYSDMMSHHHEIQRLHNNVDTYHYLTQGVIMYTEMEKEIWTAWATAIIVLVW